jgi:hypothetical protein
MVFVRRSLQPRFLFGVVGMVFSSWMFLLPVCCSAADPQLEKWIAAIQRVDREAAGHSEAIEAIRNLSQQDAEAVMPILAGMDGANPLATNWFRAAIESIADRSSDKMPWQELKSFLDDQKHSPAPRRLVYELLVARDASLPEKWLPNMLEDSCLEIRHDAVDLQLKRIQAMDAESAKPQVIAAYRELLDQARSISQIKTCIEALEKVGESVNITDHLGLITSWQLIGVFDNRNRIGFDHAYDPETHFDLKQVCQGKDDQEARWTSHQSTEKEGVVDLNKLIGKNMGAVAYAYTEFNSAEELPVEARLGTPNANKVWINGELVITNHVYHTGAQLDQYMGKFKLKPGKNAILIKIAQNEQTDEWAQDWLFQFRISDATGKAIHSQQAKKTE